jgi:hypothetical protein
MSLLTLILHRPAAPQIPAACARCRFATGGGAHLERSIPGLNVFGSGFGSSIGESCLCSRHDRLVSPGDSCALYEAPEVDAAGAERPALTRPD